jgi:hypothetical protein
MDKTSPEPRVGTVAASTAVAFVALAVSACAGGPKAPFDTLKSSNATAFRLQNYEPPPPAPGAAAPGGGMIPGVPPEIQTWIQQGAAGLQQLIPPGLLPPGLIPQGGAVAQPAPVQDTTPRFYGFRILTQTAVIDSDLKEELGDILGDEDNFDSKYHNCMYPEMGLAFGAGGPGGPSNDLLISFSCNQVQAKNFAWPHPQPGMKPSTVKELSEVVQKLWPPGT